MLMAVACLSVVVFFLNPGTTAEKKPVVLRARGLIIVDDQGRERILIGAPIPAAANRVRTNLARVRELWSKRYPNPDEYMKYYQEYRHDTNGLLVLDENGFDRIALGDPVPDPNIGKRIGPSTGVTINDDIGNERSGYGLLKAKEGYRVTFGMDTARGEEGLTLGLFDNGGPVGLMARDKDRMLFLGSEPVGDWFLGLDQPFHGLILKKGKEVTYQLNVAAKK
jgi:hypothetical protein